MTTETQARTLTKLVIYRGIIAFTTFAISLMFGATLPEAIVSGAVSFPLGSILYYFHERSWLRFSWLRNNANDTKVRSFMKTVSYRIFTAIAVFIVGRIIFIESNGTAAGYTLAIMVNGLVIFYIIERIFNRIEWGKIYNKIRKEGGQDGNATHC